MFKNMKTLNITQVANYITIDVRTLYRMIEDGRFPVKPIKGTKPRRWTVESINKWLGV